jgi:hypothetical protein
MRNPIYRLDRGRIDLAQMARCKLVVAILLVLVVTDVVRQAVPRCIIEPTWHCGCISQVAFTVGVSNEKWFDGCERQAPSFAESTRGRAIIQADCGS